MSEPYTPTEAIARGRWLNDNPSAREAFDRFLAQVRGQARLQGAVEALREAAGIDYVHEVFVAGDGVNAIRRHGKSPRALLLERADQIERGETDG